MTCIKDTRRIIIVILFQIYVFIPCVTQSESQSCNVYKDNAQGAKLSSPAVVGQCNYDNK